MNYSPGRHGCKFQRRRGWRSANLQSQGQWRDRGQFRIITRSASTTKPVLIVGAGPVGMTMARPSASWTKRHSPPTNPKHWWCGDVTQQAKISDLDAEWQTNRLRRPQNNQSDCFSNFAYTHWRGLRNSRTPSAEESDRSFPL